MNKTIIIFLIDICGLDSLSSSPLAKTRGSYTSGSKGKPNVMIDTYKADMDPLSRLYAHLEYESSYFDNANLYDRVAFLREAGAEFDEYKDKETMYLKIYAILNDEKKYAEYVLTFD